MLESRALRMFLVLAEELHFGRTADRLGLSQSVVSTQILRIEDRIGARLFERGRKSAISLTPAGATFLNEVRLAVAQLDRAERIGRMAGRGEAGPLRIGFVTSAALSGCLTTALAAVRTRFPEITVHAEPMDSPDQIEAVLDGRLDIGFIRPRSAYPGILETSIVHIDDIVLAISGRRRLAHQPQITTNDLADEIFIFPRFPDNDRFAEIVARLTANSTSEPAPHIATRDFVTALSLAAASFGIAIVPKCVGTIAMSGVVFREIGDHREQVSLALIWRRGFNARCIDLLLEALALQ